jgi:hypothetical protein
MSDNDLENESIEIIRELTKPKPIVHLTARLVALARRGIHRHLYEHPELKDDPRVEDGLDRVMEYVGAALEIVCEYEIAYQENREYGIHPTTSYRESKPVQTEYRNSRWADNDSGVNNSPDGLSVQSGPAITGRTVNDPSGDSGSIGRGFKPPRESKQPERPKRRKTDGESKSADKSKPKFTDEQP